MLNDEKDSNNFNKSIEVVIINKKNINPFVEAMKIASIYAAVGILWIWLSDTIVYVLFKDRVDLLKNINLYKGWFFIFATAVLILKLIYDKLKLLKSATDELISGYEELAATHEQLIATEQELEHNFFDLQKHRDALYISEERYKLAVEGAKDVIWSWDIQSDIFDTSIFEKTRYASFVGGNVDYDLVFSDWVNQVHPDDKDKFNQTLADYLEKKTNDYNNKFRVITDNGPIWILSRGKAIWDNNGKPIKMAGSHTNITEQINKDLRLYQLAYYDKLTGLPNRSHFENTVSDLMVSLDENCKLAMIYFDIDDFKHINDALGHSVGDGMLSHVASILKELTGSKHFIARLGGDEFAVVVDNITDYEEILPFVNDLFDKVRKPYSIHSHELYTTISMGITIYPDDSKDLSSLLRNADTALYYSKDNGKNKYAFYNSYMEEKNLYYIDMVKSIRYGIINEEYYLVYQPKFDLITKKISGVEALIRWNHPIKGNVSPGEFIPIAENSGLIETIDEWVLRNACIQMKKWVNIGITSLTMSINISGKKFLEPDLVEKVESILDEIGLEGRYLHIEITETALIENYVLAILTLNKLKSRGIKIELDDFGKGYSSLTYLKRLPVDVLKIDIEFIRNLNKSNTENAIVKAIIDLAHNLNLIVIAEGIETEGQNSILEDYGCDYGQGYLFAKPILAREIEEIYYK